jgi:hypothetical protein
MNRKWCYTAFLLLLINLVYFKSIAQSKRVDSRNELSFQYGFSLKGIVEFSITKTTQKPVIRICSDFGLGSNLLARTLYFSINTELQLYNGGLGSKRRAGHTKPGFTLDIINAFTLTTGLNNYFSTDSLEKLKFRNVPLYFFSNYSNPALQNPYNYSISAGTNFIFSTARSKSGQRVGFLNLHLNKLQVCYYNDGGSPFDETYLGDGRDRFYTGGALISYHPNAGNFFNQYELSFNKFTGYTKNAFEVSNSLDLAFVGYNRAEEKYYNKSLWSLNIANTEAGYGFNINRYNYINWDIQHLIHFSIFNPFHLVPYDDYFSVGGTYYYNYTNIGLR